MTPRAEVEEVGTCSWAQRSLSFQQPPEAGFQSKVSSLLSLHGTPDFPPSVNF